MAFGYQIYTWGVADRRDPYRQPQSPGLHDDGGKQGPQDPDPVGQRELVSDGTDLRGDGIRPAAREQHLSRGLPGPPELIRIHHDLRARLEQACGFCRRRQGQLPFAGDRLLAQLLVRLGPDVHPCLQQRDLDGSRRRPGTHTGPQIRRRCENDRRPFRSLGWRVATP